MLASDNPTTTHTSDGRMRVFVTSADILAAKEKIRDYVWARQVLADLRERSDSWLTSPLAIPGGQSGWGHNYFDPRFAVQLRYDPAKPHEHVSPVDGHVFSGGEYDAAWVYITHQRIAEATLTLALTYALTDEEHYGEGAARYLVEYAERYPETIVHGKWAGKGRMMGQSLDEAVWIIPLIQAYDLLADSDLLVDAQHQALAENLFRPAASLLQGQTSRVHNIHSWHNAAIGMVGLITADPDLVDFAVNNPQSGFVTQLTEGVRSDGLWFEGSLVYHMYTLRSIETMAMALRAAGIDIPCEDIVHSMYMVPLLFATPDMGLPALNDGWFGESLINHAGSYEVAAGCFDEPRFAQLLRRIYTTGNTSRTSLQALLFGPPTLPDIADAESEQSVLMAGSGYGILRQDRHYVLLKYGPYGGGHDHPDRLNLILFGMGEMLSPDLGSPGYSIPLHGQWFRQTISHNTIIVDETSQKAASGRLLVWIEDDGFTAISALTDEAYPGVELRRSAVLTKDLLLLVDQASSNAMHSYDWIFHSLGEWDEAAVRGLQPTQHTIPLDRVEYQPLANVQQTIADGAWQVGWISPRDQHYTLAMASSQPGTTVFLADGPANPATVRQPAVIVRQSGEKCRWAGVFDLSGRRLVEGIETVDAASMLAREIELKDDELAVRILTQEGIMIFVLGEDGDVRLVDAKE